MIKLDITDIGSKYWYLGKHFHRDNGPAIVLTSGYGLYWLHGKSYTQYYHMMLVAQEQANG